MSTKIDIAAVIGSLRTDSFHRILFEAARELAPSGVSIAEVSVATLPFFNADLEDAGDPKPVAMLKDSVRSADALLIITPEYNGSIPAVTKNAIDWLTRPPGSAPISAKATGVVAATPGRHGAVGVRQHLADVLGSNTNRLFDESLGLSSISRRMDDGQLHDEARNELGEWLMRFVEFVSSGPSD